MQSYLFKKISVYLSNKDDSSYTDSRLIEEYTEKFDELYGKSEQDIITTYWSTSKSKIGLIHLMDGLVLITYEDITKAEE